MQKYGLMIFVSLVFLTFAVPAGSAEVMNDATNLKLTSAVTKKTQDNNNMLSFEDEFKDQYEIQVPDPLSGYNRVMTNVNDKFYFWFLKPVAQGYGMVIPEFARVAINRCYINLLFPIRFVNNLLQLKFKRAGIETVRFGINTTVGVLGMGDPAKSWFDLKPYREDFGQTLGNYRMGSCFHLVLPMLGPSNMRDTLGMGPDLFLNPVNYLDDKLLVTGIHLFERINYTSLHIGEYESLKKDAVDFYTFTRDAYEQKRRKEIEE
jgi:phospholipid-binding lipoprotein MlaA